MSPGFLEMSLFPNRPPGGSVAKPSRELKPQFQITHSQKQMLAPAPPPIHTSLPPPPHLPSQPVLPQLLPRRVLSPRRQIINNYNPTPDTLQMHGSSISSCGLPETRTGRNKTLPPTTSFSQDHFIRMKLRYQQGRARAEVAG